MKWKIVFWGVFIGLFILILWIYTAKGTKPEPDHDMPLEPKALKAHRVGDHLICSQSPVEAAVGKDVTLDFHLESQRDVRTEPIEWSCNKSIHVLVYRSSGFSHVDQDDQFKGRASLDSSGNLEEGRLPFKISKVTTADAGTYRCSVGRGKERLFCSTELKIVGVKGVHPHANASQTHTEPKEEPGMTNIAGISVSIVIAIIVIAVAIVGGCKWSHRRRKRRITEEQAAAEEDKEQL